MRWIAIFMLVAVIATLGITNWELSLRVAELEAKAVKPEFVHTCEMFDLSGRRVCGYIQVEGE